MPQRIPECFRSRGVQVFRQAGQHPFHVCGSHVAQRARKLGIGHHASQFVQQPRALGLEDLDLPQQRAGRRRLRDQMGQSGDAPVEFCDLLALRFRLAPDFTLRLGDLPVMRGDPLGHLVAGETLDHALDDATLDGFRRYSRSAPETVKPTIAVPECPVRRDKQAGEQIDARTLLGRAPLARFKRGQNRLCLLVADQRRVRAALDHPFLAWPPLRAADVAGSVALGMPVPDGVAGVGQCVALDVDQ